MNNRGFTIIELVTSFALASIIFILLLRVVNIVKEVYINSNIKTELYINQASFSNLLNYNLNHKQLIEYDACDDSSFCFNFYYSDSTSSKLVVTSSQITFDSYSYKLNKNSYVDMDNVLLTRDITSSIESYNSFLIIKIPIKCNMFKNIDFGIDLVHMYNSNTINL
ncbi:MAG: hypothetical protein Q4E75_03560 [bacterium]|nr:hypothetical protein [bacterium]